MVAGVRMTKRRFLALGLVALVGSTCDVKEMGPAPAELSELQQKLYAEFGEEAIGLNLLNDERLTITLVNSPSQVDAIEREKRARAMATFAYASYSGRTKLSLVSVVFVARRSYIVFHSTSHKGIYPFPAAELAAPAPSSSAPAPAGVE